MPKNPSKASVEKIDGQMLKVRTFFVEFFRTTHYLNLKDEASELTFSDMKAIGAFRENREYTMTELARNAQVTMPSMTAMVDNLEGKGMAERWRDSNDRRVVKARLTKKGQRTLMNFMRRRKKEMEHVFSQLTTQERQELIDSLERAYTILQKINGSRSSDRARSGA